MILLDTDVRVDILRGYPPALAWLTADPAQALGVPGLVAMELLQGCCNLPEQQRLQQRLRPYARYWPSATACDRAFDDFATYRLGASLGLLDALIAHTAIDLDMELATFNRKHYQCVPDLRIIQPYVRMPG